MRASSPIAYRTLLVAGVMLAFQGAFEINRAALMIEGNDLVNTMDHAFYSTRIYEAIDWLPPFAEFNNFAVTVLYAKLAYFTGLRIEQYAFLVNIPVLLLAYVALEHLHLLIASGPMRPLYALGLLPLLAYVPLINKDAFGILFYVLLALTLRQAKPWRLMAMLALVPFRVQHPGILLLTLSFRLPALALSVRVGLLVVVYVMLAVVAGYISVSEVLFISSGATGSAIGLTELARLLNDYGYLGSILLNLTIPIKYLFDLGRSVQFDASIVGAMIMFGRTYLTILLLANLLRVLPLIYLPPYFYSRPSLYTLSSVICSFFLIWMISPVVHYRYLLNIVPLLLVALSVLSIERGSLAWFKPWIDRVRAPKF
jgi:hypothetical protein